MTNTAAKKAPLISKKKLIRIDRLAAWLAVPFLIAATVVYAIPSPPPWTQVFNLAFQLCFLIHTLLSIYRFRLPKLNRSPKIIQVYSGYGVLLTVIFNFIFYNKEPLAAIVFWANWAFVILHVVIALKLWLKRRR